MKELRKVLEDAGDQIQGQIYSRFVPIPLAVCECGKPIVFAGHSRTFVCSRCGREYELIVQVKQVE